jgi:hypothetical protein
LTEWNPVSIAKAINEASDRLEKSARIIRDCYDLYLQKKRNYTIAMAEARQQAPASSFQDRTDQALPRCAALWLEQDDAEVAYKYARDLAAALEKKLSGLQTEAKLIMQAYNVGG